MQSIYVIFKKNLEKNSNIDSVKIIESDFNEKNAMKYVKLYNLQSFDKKIHYAYTPAPVIDAAPKDKKSRSKKDLTENIRDMMFRFEPHALERPSPGLFGNQVIAAQQNNPIQNIDLGVWPPVQQVQADIDDDQIGIEQIDIDPPGDGVQNPGW